MSRSTCKALQNHSDLRYRGCHCLKMLIVDMLICEQSSPSSGVKIKDASIPFMDRLKECLSTALMPYSKTFLIDVKATTAFLIAPLIGIPQRKVGGVRQPATYENQQQISRTKPPTRPSDERITNGNSLSTIVNPYRNHPQFSTLWRLEKWPRIMPSKGALEELCFSNWPTIRSLISHYPNSSSMLINVNQRPCNGTPLPRHRISSTAPLSPLCASHRLTCPFHLLLGVRAQTASERSDNADKPCPGFRMTSGRCLTVLKSRVNRTFWGVAMNNVFGPNNEGDEEFNHGYVLDP